jgi:hypothetical protein
VRRLVRFQSDESRAVVPLFVVPCCLLGTGDLPRKVQVFQRVVLHGEAGSGMHSHLGDAGFTRLRWI